MWKRTISVSIAFVLWAAVFFTQAAFDVPYVLIMLTMFFVSLPASGWIARMLTGVDPYKAMFR